MPAMLELESELATATATATPRSIESPVHTQSALREVMREASARTLSDDSAAFVQRLDPQRGE